LSDDSGHARHRAIELSGDFIGAGEEAFFAKEGAVVFGHRSEVIGILDAKILEACDGLLEVTLRPCFVAGREKRQREVVVGLGGIVVGLAEELAACVERHQVHLASLLVVAGPLIEGADVV